MRVKSKCKNDNKRKKILSLYAHDLHSLYGLQGMQPEGSAFWGDHIYSSVITNTTGGPDVVCDLHT